MTEAEQVRNIQRWPRWPWLPVKRPETGQLGVIYADDIDLPGLDDEATGPIRVFHVNVFECTMAHAVAMTQGHKCPWEVHATYATVEAMLADGWKGD